MAKAAEKQDLIRNKREKRKDTERYPFFVRVAILKTFLPLVKGFQTFQRTARGQEGRCPCTLQTFEKV